MEIGSNIKKGLGDQKKKAHKEQSGPKPGERLPDRPMPAIQEVPRTEDKMPEPIVDEAERKRILDEIDRKSIVNDEIAEA
jgi:hypothetical protein